MLIGGYLGLFVTSFLAATLLPAASELGLAALYASKEYKIIPLVIIASLGNTLGSISNWIIGRFLERFKDRKWFPASPAQLESAQIRYNKYGYWCLLLSWMPVIGDPITLIAGVLREPFWRFVLIVGFAKTMRYVIWAVIVTRTI
ncbi:YqaA family protein [Ahrensia marina]|uniref:Membrane protein n=1 Tax=Ahrensia marina TaxID=1514904 RepID=A0A0M9GPF3_9HYPH|nr:YqaA family protein [Ahrensia marina]KPB02583.1 membrane protein [Ahrensia marina]